MELKPYIQLEPQRTPFGIFCFDQLNSKLLEGFCYWCCLELIDTHITGNDSILRENLGKGSQNPNLSHSKTHIDSWPN